MTPSFVMYIVLMFVLHIVFYDLVLRARSVLVELLGGAADQGVQARREIVH